MADVFLSYAYEDSNVASLLADQLRIHDCRVETLGDLPAGRPWAEALNEAISGARAFVLLVPAEARESVSQEAALATQLSLNTGLPVIPVLLPGRRPTSDAARFQYLTVDGVKDFDLVARTVRDLLDSQGAKRRPDGVARESLWSELLASDLGKAPQAAAIVLDQISQEHQAPSGLNAADLDLLNRAADWGTQRLGVDHPSVLLLQSRRLTALEGAQDYFAVVRLCRELLSIPSSGQQQVRLLMTLGSSLARLREYDNANSSLLTASELAESLGSVQLWSTAVSRRAEVLELQGRLPEAFEEYQLAVRLSAPLAEPGVRAQALIGLCRISSRVVGDAAVSRIAEEAAWLANSPLAGDWSQALTDAANSALGRSDK